MSSFGEQLRRERELRKVSLEEIAEATKISVRYLRALETNDFSQLPGGVFDRGFVRAYAQFVGLDEEATVGAYLAERGPDQVVQHDDGLDALRAAVEAQPGGGGSTYGIAGNRRLLRRVAVGIVAVGLLSVTAWALSRYFETEGPVAEPPRRAARVMEQSAEQQLPQTSAGDSVDEPAAQAIAVPEPAVEERPPAQPEPEPESIANPELAARGEEPAPPPPVASTDEAPSSRPNIDALILVDRPATGRVNCDNRQVELLDGLRPGTELKLQCQRFLLLNVRDGGAVRVGLNGKTPMQLTADGQPLDDYGIYP